MAEPVNGAEGTDGGPESAAKRQYPEFAWGFIAVKNGQQIALKGKSRFADLASARDTLFIIALRDSRILEARVMDPKTGEILWAALPGIIKLSIEEAGFTPDLITGVDMLSPRGGPRGPRPLRG